MESKTDFDEKKERLKRISIFLDVADNDRAMNRIAQLFETLSYPCGHYIIREGDEGGENFYIIKKGTVEVVKKTQDDDTYTVVELSGGMNIFFGEIALLDPDKRSASVICKTDCEFYVLDRNRFLAFGEEDPKTSLLITRQLSQILCRRLRKANSDIITLFEALVTEVEQSGGLS